MSLPAILPALQLVLLPLSQSASNDIARAEQERLNACIQKVEDAPLEAYEDSLAWLSSGNRPRARYCNAIALLAIEEYEEGAVRLESLARAPDPISLEDRALYMAQAGNAWLVAQYPDAAVVALTEALDIQTSDPDLFKDRAAAYLALEQWADGIADLDAALALVPTDPEALTMRARAHLKSENYAGAEADMTSALRQDPENLDILVLRGDIREAIRLSREIR